VTRGKAGIGFWFSMAGKAAIVLMLTGGSGTIFGAHGLVDDSRLVRVVLANAPVSDAAFDLALRSLQTALRERRWEVQTSTGECSLRKCIFIAGSGQFKNDRAVASQSFKIEPIAIGLKISSAGIGLIYALFRLADEVRQEGLNWALHKDETPAFPERVFSYEGTLLDLPDEGYYFRHAPFVNELLV
jgi:hypothetical protein